MHLMAHRHCICHATVKLLLMYANNYIEQIRSFTSVFVNNIIYYSVFVVVVVLHFTYNNLSNVNAFEIFVILMLALQKGKKRSC